MPLPSYRAIELSLLQEILAAGGEVRPRDVYPRMRKHFPDVPETDFEAQLSTGGNSWTNRIQWARQSLVTKGDLHREPRGLWRLTSRGESRAKGEALPEKLDNPHAVSPTTLTPPSAITAVPDRVDALCTRLIQTQKQSSAPKNFEGALADAFSFLGFDVQSHGKSGETDVLLDTHVGADSYRVVVDAKATHGDRVSDSQINWLAINQHQTQAEANHASVVGVAFSGGNLLKWAEQHQVSLIRTADLVDVMRMHRQAPFSIVDLRPLFAAPGPTQKPLQNLRVLFQSTIQHWQLLLDVVDLVDNYNRINMTGLIATAERIQLMLYMKVTSRASGGIDPSHIPTTEDVREALTFLSSRAVGILRESPTGSSGSSRLTCMVVIGWIDLGHPTFWSASPWPRCIRSPSLRRSDCS